MSEAYFRARYAEARTIFPLLPPYPRITADAGVTITTERFAGDPPFYFNVPPGFDLEANDRAHHVCKHEAGHAYIRTLERLHPGVDFLAQFRSRFGYAADEESWAEVFANACEGKVVTSKSFADEQVDPLAARAFFLGLSGQNPQTLVPTQKVPVIQWVGPAAGGNYMAGRNGNPVTLIVDHWTTGSKESALARFQQPGQQVSAHYIVGQDGSVWQVVKDADTAYHAGEWTRNLLSIGIEHECGPTLPPTDALYEASAWLHRVLADAHDIALEVGQTVLRHREIVATACPGTLEVERIVSMATEYVTKAEFQQYQADVKATIDAMKQAYDPLVGQAHPKGHTHPPTQPT